MRTGSHKRSLITLGLAAVVTGLLLDLPLQQNAAAQQAQAQGRGARGGGGRGAGGGGGGGAGRGGFGGAGTGYAVYRGRIDPHWFRNNTAFWYRNDLKGEGREFILVDAQAASRAPAFDHARLATALSKVADLAATADHLPFDAIDFTVNANQISAVRFTVNGATWSCDLSSYQLTRDQGPPVNARIPAPFIPEPLLATQRPYSSDDSPATLDPLPADPEASFVYGPQPFVDFRGRTPDLSSADALFARSLTSDGEFLNLEGFDSPFAPPPPPAPQQTQPDQAGRGTSRGGADTAGDAAGGAGGRGARGGAGGARGGGGGRGAGRGGPDVPIASPDGKYTASIANYNIVLRFAAGEESPITTDGVADNYYTRLSWTQDSASLIAWRRQPGNPLDVYRINVAPRGPNGENLLGGAGRAQPITAPYALPGDKYDNYELNLFDVAAKKQIRPDVGIIDATAAGSNPFTPQFRWKKDNVHFTYEKYDRGHQRVRLIEVDAHTGQVRNLVDDVADGKTQRFIWSANRDGVPSVPMFTYLPNENEVIYSSEMDGWRHLYLSDASSATPTFKQIDHGNWILRGIDYIDNEARQIWFSCGGVYPDQDRMLLHYGHVNFDGSNQVIMTAGNGNHSITYSPDYKYIIDTYGNVDMPPVSELRRVSDGKLVVALEKAQVEGTWRHPVAFSAKGKDGVTDIWGVISLPNDFDPTKKYPVIEDIYAGPQGTPSTMTPKTFGTAPRNGNLLNLGFITVKIDAPGSFGGSKAYHDVCWHNLHDAAWEDRIAWYKAAALKFTAMDLDRVGIFGTSAGGQNAAAAVLWHPEFYKVAVANSGCHDNRMDKSTWNEQWMGYPVGPWYGENSNIDNAYRLQGHLQLVVGDQDTNVPPESTFRFVDALVQAGKDFELVDIPGANHGAASSITQRKLNDFFVRYLQGAEPPNHNLEPPPAGRGGRGAGGRGARGGATTTAPGGGGN